MKCQRCCQALPNGWGSDCHDASYWDAHLDSVLTGGEYAYPDPPEEPTATWIVRYNYHGAKFLVLLASPDDKPARTQLIPPGYDFSQALEGLVLNELDDMHSAGFATASEEAQCRGLEREFAACVGVAALPLMQRLASSPVPAPQTLQEELYPPTFALQAFTADGTLVCREIDAISAFPDRHPPVQEARLRAAGIDLAHPGVPVVDASQVELLVHWTYAVWLVRVGDETLVCKASRRDFWEHTLGLELEAYRKLGVAEEALRVPHFRGVVKSHKGVIGILLDYIPHSHRSLRTLLRGVRNGTTPGHAASLPRRLRWAEQIRHTVTRLHELGVIWGCAKLDNVLIDNQGNAVALSLGGGNTTGGKDRGEEDVRGREAQGLLRGVSDALVLPN